MCVGAAELYTPNPYFSILYQSLFYLIISPSFYISLNYKNSCKKKNYNRIKVRCILLPLKFYITKRKAIYDNFSLGCEINI